MNRLVTRLSRSAISNLVVRKAVFTAQAPQFSHIQFRSFSQATEKDQVGEME